MFETSTRLSVTQFHHILHNVLKDSIGEVQVEAEISQITRASSGHIYLTLKDSQSQIGAVIWRSLAQRLKFKIDAGVMVLCTGEPGVYPATGKLQFILRKIEPAGEGLLQKKFLELKAKLEREGLFDPARKRPLPFLPKGIGIVTSASGAAIHDMMVKFQERLPQIPIFLVDSRVQGAGASSEIARGIEYLNSRDDIDLIIIGRGGGSLEDLWSFNEEVVCRAVFASRIPVISAVGHEVDIALSDLVADVRAPTPTAAAEVAVPHRRDLRQQIERSVRVLDRIHDYLGQQVQRVDEGERRFRALYGVYFERVNSRMERATQGLERIHPTRLMERSREKMKHLEFRLQAATKQGLMRCSALSHQLGIRLESVNPTNTLRRGYFMVEHKGGILNKVGGISVGDELALIGYDGRVSTVVRELSVHEEERAENG